jgi:hypothetical protein
MVNGGNKRDVIPAKAGIHFAWCGKDQGGFPPSRE